MAQPSLRIATLLPSLTEIAASIPSLRDKIVAVTHECDYPLDVVSKCAKITTSTFTPHNLSQGEIDRLVKGSLAVGHSLYGIDEKALTLADPNIVFTQALCDVCAVSYPIVLGTCSKLLGDDPKVVSIEPECLSDVIASIITVGEVTGYKDEATNVAQKLEDGFKRIESAVAGKPRPKVAFLEWTDPLFNGGHWIPDMLHIAGGTYTMTQSRQRSVQFSSEELVSYDADVILVAPCGFDCVRAAADTQQLWKHEWWRGLRAVQDRKVFALDGNAYYARPGPRLLQGTGIIARLLHGDEIANAVGEDIAPKCWIVVQPPTEE